MRRDKVGPEVFLRDSAEVSEVTRRGEPPLGPKMLTCDCLLQSAAAAPEAFPLHLGVQAGEGVRPRPAAGEHGGVHGAGEGKREARAGFSAVCECGAALMTVFLLRVTCTTV